MMRYILLTVLTGSVFAFIGACSGGDDDDGGGGGGGSSNAAPVLTTPNATGGDIVIGGSVPNYTGICETEDNLSITFIATDTDVADTLTTTISVTGGTLTATQAGFAETFPYTPSPAVSPHAISLSGSAGGTSGSIELTVDTSDGNAGTDQLVFTLVIKAAFDFNADGYNDVIVANIFSAYIFLGSATPAATTNTSAADVRIAGADRRVAPAGDVNGDGYDDVIFGNIDDSTGGSFAGAAHVVFGSATPPSTINPSTGVKLIGEASQDGFGGSVSSAGDIDGDGYADVIVGADGDDDGGSNSGCAFIFFGSSINTAAAGTGTIDASSADVKLIGEDADDHFGIGVSLAGDVNNDGNDDVIVGAFWDDDGGANSGCAFIFFGSSLTTAAAGSGSIDSSVADVKLVGEAPNDVFGYSVSSAGDVNGDGSDDVIVGASGNVSTNGAAYVFFGSSLTTAAAGTGTIDASAADVKLVAEGSGDWFGRSVSSAGDVNSDGSDDVIVGAVWDDDGGSNSGCAFIFFGTALTTAAAGTGTINASAAAVKLTGGDIDDWFGESVSSAGDVNGDGFGDVVVGAVGDDNGGTGLGCAFVFFGSATPLASRSVSAADMTLVADSGQQFGSGVGG